MIDPNALRQAADALLSYKQADAEGVMVTVSRQACDECATAIDYFADLIEGPMASIEVITLKQERLDGDIDAVVSADYARQLAARLALLSADNAQLHRSLDRLNDDCLRAEARAKENEREAIPKDLRDAWISNCCGDTDCQNLRLRAAILVLAGRKTHDHFADIVIAANEAAIDAAKGGKTNANTP